MRLKKDIQGRALCALFGATVMVLPHGAAGAVENETTDTTVVEVATSQESEANESQSEVSQDSQESEVVITSEKPAANEIKPAVTNETEAPAVAEVNAASASVSTAAVAPQSANVVKTGWVLAGGRYYYNKADGARKTGWVLDAGKWYYLSPSSGVMKTGWVQDGGKWYLLDGTGAMVTGWIAQAGKWYLLDGTGAMVTGWAKTGGVWYYLNANGSMKTGWLQYGGSWYFLKSNGAMATGQLTIGGKTESFDGNGVWRDTASSKGQAILNTAKAYQGAPYVWGGTTPSGWDCIGFVRYVYAQHGVSIGGYTTSVLSAGRQVSYSQVQAGDILYWPGHVAIYAGNGQNIGAWNPDMGTTTGPNSWLGTPTVIRVFG